MALSTRPNGYLINADDDWNPLINQVNATAATIAGTTANGGISDINSRFTTLESGKVAKTQSVKTANGLTGGGALSGDLTLSPSYGTGANTVAQGNDSRINNGQTAYATTTNATTGNLALDTRLGSGITTSNTATSQLAGINSKIGTGVGTDDTVTGGASTSGTVGAQLAYIRANSGGGGGSSAFPPQAVSLTQSAISTLASQTNNQVGNWKVAGSQTGSMFTSGNAYLTIPASGFYLFAGALVVSYDTNGTTVVYFNVESTTGNNDFSPASDGHNVLGSTYMSPVGGGGVGGSSVPIPLTAASYLTAGQKVCMVCWSGSVTRKTVANYGGQTVFSAVRLV